MVLLFRHPYERRAEKAAEGGAKVVVVGPPGAGKTTFIKQFLEPRGVVAAEETAGLAPGNAAGESLVQRLRRRVWGRYVRGDEVKEELAGIGGADYLKAFDKLPRDFVEYLKERYRGWSLYLFYIPPDAEYEEAKRLRAVMEEVGVEFRWFGLSYLPPGLAKALAEKGEDYVRRQLKLYKKLAAELDIAEGRLGKIAKAATALENLLGQVKEVAGRLIDVAAPGAGVAVSILTEVLAALLFSRGGRGELVKLVAGLGELDGDLRNILAARLALTLGLDRGAVEKALATLAGADVEKLAEEVKALKNAADKLWVEVKSAKRGVDVLFLEDVELGGLYENFVVLNERPYVDLQEGLFPLVAGGRFEEEAGRVLEKLESGGVAVLVGPKGIGKSTLAAYVVWKMLSSGEAEAAIRVEKSVKELTLKRIMELVKRKTVVLYDPSPLEVYYKHKYMEKAERPEEVIEALEELADFLQSGGGGVRLLVVLPTDLYEVVKDKMPEAFKNAVLEIKLNDVEFLQEVVRRYSGCGGDYSKLAEKIAQFKGGYTLAAKYAGLWLRDSGCKVESVERAVEEAKREPKLFLAHYIWHVLLRGSGDLARRVAVPLLLHAVFGPVPIGVTYITKAVNYGVWRFLKPEELEGAGLESLREDELEPIAKWLAQRHEDLVEETLRDLAGLNGEEARKPSKETLDDLIKALDWARSEVLKEGGEILAALGIPEKGMGLEIVLLVFVNRRLAAVFKSGESKRCWKRTAFIVGHALVIFPKVSRREQLSEDSVEVLGDVLEPCAVDNYLMIDDKMTPLSIYMIQLMSVRKEFNILSPFADKETVEEAKKTVEKLLGKWRRKGFTPPEVFYALGLAVLATEGDVDEGTADLLLYAASAAVQLAAHPAAVLPVLATLRSLGVKAPHRYVATLAAASELTTLDQGTVWYIYFTLQQLENRLLRSERIWPLVYAVNAYSNLLIKHLIKHLVYIKDYWGNAAADMCQLYSEIKRRCAMATSDGNLSAQRLLAVAAAARVLAVALYSDALAQLVQALCGLDDLEREAEAVRNTLEEAAARPNELRKIMESDADFAEWVTTQSATGDAGMAIEELMAWFVQVLARYKLNHAINKEGELDEKRLEEAANMFRKIAEIYTRPEQRGDYFIVNSWALRAHILAAKSWVELLDRAKGYWELWKEAEKSRIPTARYLEAAALTLGECLVYLVASGKKEEASKLLKKYRVLLDYVPEVSVATRLMLKLLGLGEGAKLEEIIQAFEPMPLPKYLPAILMLVGRLQREGALEECAKLPEAEECVIAVAAAAGNQEAVERLKSEIEREMPEAHPLLEVADGKTLVEILVPKGSTARLAFMLLAAVEGRVDAVRLHGLWGSAQFTEPLPRQLSRAVYENCGDLNSEECRMALLKLYYLHY